MSNASSLARTIREIEPRLTQLVREERAEEDIASIRVCVIGGLTTAALAILNIVGDPDGVANSDRLVEDILGSTGKETVRLDRIILDADLCSQARQEIMGANGTSAQTALGLMLNICGPIDMKRMLSMDKGPMGPLGGVAVVLCQRLLGEERAARMMMVSLEAAAQLADSIAGKGRRSASSSVMPPKGSGCALASLAVLTGVCGGAAGLVAVVRNIM